nr:formin-like protein 6 [Aegilops tauschii subsp. strangulata]
MSPSSSSTPPRRTPSPQSSPSTQAVPVLLLEHRCHYPYDSVVRPPASSSLPVPVVAVAALRTRMCSWPWPPLRPFSVAGAVRRAPTAFDPAPRRGPLSPRSAAIHCRARPHPRPPARVLAVATVEALLQPRTSPHRLSVAAPCRGSPHPRARLAPLRLELPLSSGRPRATRSLPLLLWPPAPATPSGRCCRAAPPPPLLVAASLLQAPHRSPFGRNPHARNRRARWPPRLARWVTDTWGPPLEHTPKDGGGGGGAGNLKCKRKGRRNNGTDNGNTSNSGTDNGNTGNSEEDNGDDGNHNSDDKANRDDGDDPEDGDYNPDPD